MHEDWSKTQRERYRESFSNGGVHGGPTDMWEREREVEEEDNG